MDKLQSINPANDQLLQTYSLDNEHVIQDKIEQCGHQQYLWTGVKLQQRISGILTLARLLRETKTQQARLITREMGKPLQQAEQEIEKCAWLCEYYAENAERFLADRWVKTDDLESFITYQPLGCIVLIMPWNFPFWQVFRAAVPVILAGNAVLLKHAANVSGCALAIRQLFLQALVPVDIFQVLLIRPKQLEQVIAHPFVQGVSLTGSESAGKSIAAIAGKYLKKTVLELGGSDPYLVLKDADIGQAVTACGESRMLNSGQVCIAAKRFIVVDEVYDDFKRQLLNMMQQYLPANPLLPDTRLGPLAKPSIRQELHTQVMQSIQQGAILEWGGEIPKGPGNWYMPTLLSEVTPGMPAFDEELFGPVSVLIRAADEEQAIVLANQSFLGLGAAVFTRDVENGRKICRDRLQVGNCVVNGFVKSDPRLPFGGIKNSGFGRELGQPGMHEFVNIKTVVVR